jgi:hypothetical protein
MDPITGGTEFSIAPDGSPVFTRDTGSQEVFALKSAGVEFNARTSGQLLNVCKSPIHSAHSN